MAHLLNDIYVRKEILISMIANAKTATHVVRRLIPGVFKLETIRNGTLSGNSWINKNTDENRKVLLLHPVAIETIISKSET